MNESRFSFFCPSLQRVSIPYFCCDYEIGWNKTKRKSSKKEQDIEEERWKEAGDAPPRYYYFASYLWTSTTRMALKYRFGGKPQRKKLPKQVVIELTRLCVIFWWHIYTVRAGREALHRSKKRRLVNFIGFVVGRINSEDYEGCWCGCSCPREPNKTNDDFKSIETSRMLGMQPQMSLLLAWLSGAF